MAKLSFRADGKTVKSCVATKATVTGQNAGRDAAIILQQFLLGDDDEDDNLQLYA